MNVIEFNSKKSKELVFCMLDTTHKIVDPWAKELIKNQADYTLSNLWNKGYTVLQGLDEDELLIAASKKFNHAVLFSTGTEFLTEDFFKEIEKQIKLDYLLQGHILDRGDAFFELHQQCYLINLIKYKTLDYPEIGNQELGKSHFQFIPNRSEENIHDDYTPIWIQPGNTLKEYHHKCHGWNILSIGLSQGSLFAFNNTIRNSKKHFYPEDTESFYSHLDKMYFRNRFSVQEKIFKTHTETPSGNVGKIRQVVAPASGEWYKQFLDTTNPCNVIIYDYNQSSLDFWKQHTARLPNTTYQFIKHDLLSDDLDFMKYLDVSLSDSTLINLSDIFCYVGTAMITNTKYRNYRENKTIEYFKKHMPECFLNFSGRASSGFVENTEFCSRAKNTKLFKMRDFKKPTWHINNDWL